MISTATLIESVKQMANGDASSIKLATEDAREVTKLAHTQERANKATTQHNLFSDAYDFVGTNITTKRAEAAAVTAALGVATLALRHYIPATVAEKITATGSSILERTIGVAKAPNAILEFKVLDGSERVESLIAKLRRNEITSDLSTVREPKTGAEIKLLTGHSPIAPEATAGADRIATCELPKGCESKGIFAEERGKVYLGFDKETQTISFSQTPEKLAHRIARILQGDTEAWVPLGTQPSNDLKALRADRAVMPNLKNAEAIQGDLTNRTREIVAKWERLQGVVDLDSEPQGLVARLIRRQILPELQASGQISKDWRLVQTQVNSASDRAGVDAFFVNQTTGKTHLIDFSEANFKRNRPVGESPNVRRAGITERPLADYENFVKSLTDEQRNKIIPLVRTPGLVGFDSKWFDQMGKLDTDIPQAAQFKKDLAVQLRELTRAPAYFTADKTPFADILKKDATIQIKQLEALKEWSLVEAAKSDSLHPKGYKEYADAMKKSIDFLNAKFVNAGESPHLVAVTQQAAEQSIFKWVLDKLEPSIKTEGGAAARVVTQPAITRPPVETKLKYLPGAKILTFPHDGLTYSTKPLTGHGGVLDRGRLALLQEGRIKELLDELSDKKKKRVFAHMGSPGKPASEEVAIKKISSVLIERGNEIKAGGQVGISETGDVPPLIKGIQERLEIRNTKTLTRPLDIPDSLPKLDPKNLPRMQ